jgi:hypothetical protein
MFSFFKKFQSEIISYDSIRAEDLQVQEKKNVLLFWKTRNTKFPILRTLAQMLLASVV